MFEVGKRVMLRRPWAQPLSGEVCRADSKMIPWQDRPEVQHQPTPTAPIAGDVVMQTKRTVRIL